MGRNLDEMRKEELMKYAASLGVATRKQGTKLWRAVSDVRQDCKLREAAEQQRSRALAGEPGSASSSLAVPSASRGLAPTQTSSAHAGESGSANSDEMRKEELMKYAASREIRR